MRKVLVSACLLGERVRYNAEDASCPSAILRRWQGEGRVVPFCPEVAGGQAVPRPPAEISGGDGVAVLRRRARVIEPSGRDVTGPLLAGAGQALEAALRNDVGLAVLKEGSPSCGSRFVHDGTFSGARRPGPGVTAALLSEAGIRVFGESELEAASRYLEGLEAQGSGKG